MRKKTSKRNKTDAKSMVYSELELVDFDKLERELNEFEVLNSLENIDIDLGSLKAFEFDLSSLNSLEVDLSSLKGLEFDLSFLDRCLVNLDVFDAVKCSNEELEAFVEVSEKSRKKKNDFLDAGGSDND